MNFSVSSLTHHQPWFIWPRFIASEMLPWVRETCVLLYGGESSIYGHLYLICHISVTGPGDNKTGNVWRPIGTFYWKATLLKRHRSVFFLQNWYATVRPTSGRDGRSCWQLWLFIWDVEANNLTNPHEVNFAIIAETFIVAIHKTFSHSWQSMLLYQMKVQKLYDIYRC